MSIESGCTELEAVYQASTTADIVRYSKNEKKMIFSALRDTIPKHMDQIRIFSPRSSLYALARENDGDTSLSNPCQGGINYFFVDSRKGNTFPCGYRGKEDFGKLWALNRTHQGAIQACRRCDWECFRDPLELAAPVLDLLSTPLILVKKITGNPDHYKSWVKDLSYYRSCDYFNGRKPPDYRKMARFKKENSFTQI